MHTATYLFVPAHEPRKVERAMTAGSDAVILDLEDGVPDSRKAAAREAVSARAATPGGPDVWVRVNADPQYFEPDVRAVDWRAVTGAILPKAEDPYAVVRLDAAGAGRILLLIESVAGLHALHDLARSSARVGGCVMGALDFALDVGLLAADDDDESELMWHVRAELVLACRAAGLPPPIDGVYVRLDDEAGLRRTCTRAHRLGYVGKLLIHPRQIPIAAAVFRPTVEDLDIAREILEAYEDAVSQGRGAIAVRGTMVDRPVAARARALLARWSDANDAAPEARRVTPKGQGS